MRGLIDSHEQKLGLVDGEKRIFDLLFPIVAALVSDTNQQVRTATGDALMAICKLLIEAKTPSTTASSSDEATFQGHVLPIINTLADDQDEEHRVEAAEVRWHNARVRVHDALLDHQPH
jgi:hypothetical protein